MQRFTEKDKLMRLRSFLLFVLLIGMMLCASPRIDGAQATALSQSTGKISTVEAASHLAPFSAANGIMSQNIELLGHIGGATEAVFVQGQYAYISEGPRLAILDISNSSSPLLLGKTAPMNGLVRDIVVVDSIAYVVVSMQPYGDNGEGSLHIINISNPAAPVEISSFDTHGNALRVFIANGMAYVADGNGGLRIIDVSNPIKPVEKAVLPYVAYGVFVINHTVYIASAVSLLIVDMSDPKQPTLVGSSDEISPYDVVVEGNTAYVAGHYNLTILDVSNPNHPIKQGSFEIFDISPKIFVENEIVYIADHPSYYGQKLRIVNVSDPATPIEIGTYESQFTHFATGEVDVFFIDSKVYMSRTDGGLQIIDVSKPATPTALGFYDSFGIYSQSISVEGDTAYIAESGKGLTTLDISNPKNIVQLGLYDSPGQAIQVFVENNTAYLADGDGGLRIIDITNPVNPNELGFYNEDRLSFSDIFVSGTTAYAVGAYANEGGGGSWGLFILDITNSVQPQLLSFYPTSPIGNVFMKDNVVYLAGNSDLKLIDISNPANPVYLGSYAPGNYVGGVYVVGHIAYAITYNELHIIDVSSPSTLSRLGLYPVAPNILGDIIVENNIAYLALGDGGLRLLDVSDPTNITELGFYKIPGIGNNSTALSVKNGIAYLIYQNDGLYILRYTGSNSGSYSISGRVTDNLGQVIPGATVSDGVGHNTSTDGGGNYGFLGLSTGSYTITPVKDGYTFSSLPVSVPPDGENINFIGTAAPSTYNISGRVTDGNGSGIAGVTVSDGAGHSTITDDLGNYGFLGLATGSYTITPLKANYTFSPTRLTVTVPPEVSEQNFLGTPTTTSCRTVEKVSICANNFSSSVQGWTASGTVSIGEYTFVEDASVTLSSGTLTGNGIVHMFTKADASQSTSLFRDSFSVNTNNGVLTPGFSSGYQFLLNKLVGFSVQQELYKVTLDVLQGQVRGEANLAIVIPGNNVVKTIGFIIDHTGGVSGSLSNVSFDLGRVKLEVQQAVLGPDGLTIQSAQLQLPSVLGGAAAALSIENARITGDGQLTLVGGSASFNFPNIYIGGANGFSIEGATTTLSIHNGEYRFQGAGAFVFPGMGRGSGGCRVSTSFTLASSPPPVREASLALDGCFKIPIGSTGFFLTSVKGTVTLDETTVAVDLGIGIAGGPDIPGLGAAISGNPNAHWDNRWSVGLSGTLNVFRWQVADASLSLSPREGLAGTLHITVLGVIDGNGRLRVWKDTSKFHFTGQAQVSVQILTGAILHLCSNKFGVEVCVNVPPEPIIGPNASSNFGEFRTPESSAVYGLKGQVSVLGYNPAFFVDVNGNLSFHLGGLQEYKLVEQPAFTVSALQVAGDVVYPVTVDQTPALIVAMGHNGGNLILSLTDPTGRILTPETSDPAIFYTSTSTQTLYTIANPQPGEWSVTVGNRTGNEHYLLSVVGAPVASVISQAPILTAHNGGYTINLKATGAPTATYSLFYDNDATGNDGRAIATGVSLNKVSVNWDTDTTPQGTYYVYGIVDDPFNAPVVAYSATPVIIQDNTPPDVPTNLSVSSIGSNATINWLPSTASDVVGYHIYYREPDNGVTFVADIPNGQQSSYIQQGLYLNGNWEVAISAYDINDNESTRSATTVITVDLNNLNKLSNIYLPLMLMNSNGH